VPAASIIRAVIALMMEAARTSEMSVNFYQATRRNNPEDSHLQTIPCFQEYLLWFSDESKNIIVITRKMKMAVFWVVTPCSLVEFYQRFRGPCCLHHQGDETPTPVFR
jgi:hypothetical protein